MHKRLMQALLFLGVISIPTFASAEGGLLSTVTNEVNTVTDEATSTVDEAISAPDEERDGPSTKTTSKDEDQQKGSILTDTVDQVTGTVTNTVEKTAKAAGDTVNKTVQRTTEPVTKIAGDSAAPVTDTVNNTTKAVTTTVEKTTKNVTDTVEATSKKAIDTVEETARPVTESDGKPLTESNPTDEADTVIVEEVNMEDDKGKVKQVEPPESSSVKIDQHSIRVTKAKQIKENILTQPLEAERGQRNNQQTADETSETDGKRPFTPAKQIEPMLTTTNMNTTNQSTSANGVSGHNAGSTSIWYVEQQAMAVNLQKASVYEKKNLYYDQWLNAPPSQPPQTSLLFKSI
ncbi:hypothetical protein [Bacillus sp. KH172YL63]|uniref:hypothetical protein n=1 Tax=Bacillus sp. KH172YL63 TaxID=2709784 RepID=UPI0013E46029|nr:hypothetical protein [Bacillus sp. KH172YL63]BCB02437.1 hypothetical protein KH172YL63_05700 [Bacillus sp. KH172YL63]